MIVWICSCVWWLESFYNSSETWFSSPMSENLRNLKTVAIDWRWQKKEIRGCIRTSIHFHKEQWKAWTWFEACGKDPVGCNSKGTFPDKLPWGGGRGVEEVGDGAASEWTGQRWVVELLCNPLRKVITTSQDSQQKFSSMGSLRKSRKDLVRVKPPPDNHIPKSPSHYHGGTRHKDCVLPFSLFSPPWGLRQELHTRWQRQDVKELEFKSRSSQISAHEEPLNNVT